MGQSLYFTSKKLSIAFSDNFFSFSDWIYGCRFFLFLHLQRYICTKAQMPAMCLRVNALQIHAGNLGTKELKFCAARIGAPPQAFGLAE